MITRNDLKPFILEALKDSDGAAQIFQICKYVWDNYHHKISKDEKLLYTWQYEIRWAGQQLQKEGRIIKGQGKTKGEWRIVN